MHLAIISTIASALVPLVYGQQNSSCPGVPGFRYGFAIDPQFRAVKVAGGLTRPRGIARDRAGRLLIVESGKGITQHAVGTDGCIIGSVVLLGLASLNHGIYLSPDESKLYASTGTEVYSWSYDSTTGAVGNDQTTLVKGMRNSGHTTRTLAIPPSHPNLLVVSHGSDGNMDYPTVSPSAARAIVKVFDLNSTPAGGFDYVTQGWNAGYGLRNEVGLAFDANEMLWGVENSGDDFVRTVDGVSTDIHTDNPADELNYLGDVSKPNDQWYGYPTCYTVGGPSEIKDATFALGDQFVLAPNSTFNDTTCIQASVPPRLTLPAHSAPLDAKFDSVFQNLFVTLHGSWNRQPPSGYRVVRVPFTKANDGSFAPVAASNQVGFTDVFYPLDTTQCSAQTCTRPVAMVFDAAGRLYVTSDTSGELFLIEGA
ncbi:uncharacterized protein JN550_007907 [Neoarthrinium moseri]|uniref:uncharacterized protein n=1 Tax=Neoarthrinium moseri TaxID=1658444 RepID=UPI001FDE180B|nr:uncharacterized protein JN550_007907 [Neoarthrinium moseri]KAI1866218.1 hypothetical protein JN550_007907 [Neoarthrinium moseri]